MKSSTVYIILMGLFLVGVFYNVFVQSGNQSQQIQLEQQRVDIERAEFMRLCIDDGDRSPEDCEAFLEGQWSRSKLYDYDGC